MDGKYDTGWKPGNDVEEIYQLGKACVAGVAGFNNFWDKDELIEMLSAAQEGSWLSAGVDFDTILIRLGLLAYI